MAKNISQLTAENDFLRSRLQMITRQVGMFRDKDKQHMALTDMLFDKYTEIPPHADLEHGPLPFDGITFVIAAYNIPQQIERTLMTCSPHYQKAPPQEIEIIVVDNGSKTPLTMADFKKFPRVTKVINVEGKPSPVFGLNEGIKAARFSNVAIIIDGAHMLTPGVFKNTKAMCKSFTRPVINIPQYILGRVSQNLNTNPDAFARESEDLKAIGWPGNGYELFNYAVMPGENMSRNFYNAVETNCLITNKTVLEDCGAFNEKFDEPGAGLANLELFMRLCNNPDNQYIMIPGEGSFHQDHGGTTTNPSPEERDKLVQEYFETYKKITGDKRLLNVRGPFVYGNVHLKAANIPTISREYGEARTRILGQLAHLYTMRAKQGQGGEVPHLVASAPTDEHILRPTLKPLGLLEKLSKEQNLPAQQFSYLTLLKKMHKEIKPKLYFEIGINTGSSMALANCPAIGVDPDCELKVTLKAPTRVHRIKSDTFFASENMCQNLFKNGIDLSFIDGMHLAEFVVRDVFNTEKYMNERGVMVLDDIYPEQIEMSRRPRDFNAWCGDVYKIIPVLQEYRPDLKIDVLEAFIGPYRKGIAVISGFDPENTVLQDNYKDIEAGILGDKYNISTIDDLEKIIPASPVSELEKILQART